MHETPKSQINEQHDGNTGSLEGASHTTEVSQATQQGFDDVVRVVNPLAPLNKPPLSQLSHPEAKEDPSR